MRNKMEQALMDALMMGGSGDEDEIKMMEKAV